jgi:queuine tRNA-ribosyltransferase
MNFSFEVIYQSKKSKARVGKIHTPHGTIDTPSFVAVGTNATIKALDSKMLENINLDLMFCNTYHLLLQPGPEVVQKAGGLHKFMNRTKPIITDSGGFQVFSLAYGSVADELKSKGKKKSSGSVLKISEEGVTFRSYVDGKKILLTPETSIQIQKALGADIILPFDELPPYHVTSDYLKKSLDRTHRWQIRSLKEHQKNVLDQALYGIVHGGIQKELRQESCHVLREKPFDGFAIGGSFGKTLKDMVNMVSFTVPCLPEEKPIHLLGIADLPSIQEIIPLGIDTFDSSYPTRVARHGLLLTHDKTVKIKASENRALLGPIEEGCSCFTCQHYSRAYLHHLFKANELTFYTLATIHNLHFMVNYLKEIRQAILDDRI